MRLVANVKVQVLRRTPSATAAASAAAAAAAAAAPTAGGTHTSTPFFADVLCLFWFSAIVEGIM